MTGAAQVHGPRAGRGGPATAADGPSPATLLVGVLVAAIPLAVALPPFGDEYGAAGAAARVALGGVALAWLVGALAVSRERRHRPAAWVPRAVRLAVVAGGVAWAAVAVAMALGRAAGACPELPYPALMAGPMLGVSGCLPALGSRRIATTTTGVLVGCGWLAVAALWPVGNGQPGLAAILGAVGVAAEYARYALPWVLLALLPWPLAAASAAVALLGGRLRLGRLLGSLLIGTAFPAITMLFVLSGGHSVASSAEVAAPDPVSLNLLEFAAIVLVGCAWSGGAMLARAAEPVAWAAASLVLGTVLVVPLAVVSAQGGPLGDGLVPVAVSLAVGLLLVAANIAAAIGAVLLTIRLLAWARPSRRAEEGGPPQGRDEPGGSGRGR